MCSERAGEPQGQEQLYRALVEQSPVPMVVAQATEAAAFPIIICNRSAARMHGYEIGGDLLHRPLPAIMGAPADLAAMAAEARMNGSATRELEHHSRDGSSFRAAATIVAVRLSSGEALLITTADRYRSIFDRLPSAIVVIDPTQGVEKWPIEDCNAAFLQMNGYSDAMQLIGRDIRLVSFESALDAGTGDAYRKAYYEKLSYDEPMTADERHRRPDGSTFWIQISSWLMDLDGQQRVIGVDRDITQERLLKDVQEDIGRTLHTFTSTMLHVNQSLKVFRGALGPTAFAEGWVPAPSDVWAEMKGLLQELVASVDEFRTASKSSARHWEALTPEDWEVLDEMREILASLEHDNLRVPVSRKAARRITAIVDRLPQGVFARDLPRKIHKAAGDLDRMTCHVSLAQVQDAMVDAAYLAKDVGERVVGGPSMDVEKRRIPFWDMVAQVVQELSEYADSKNVDLPTQDDTEGACVLVVRANIVRALNNLLNNAIKYSWVRLSGARPFVSIWGSVEWDRSGQERVLVRIEDYGVPIPRSEIEKELIFELGYRSRLATAWARPGTGVGLYDARETARQFGGDVTLESRPAWLGADPDDARVPHIKTATLWLPLIK
jgi:PAS domain S-box-containing protein